MAPVTATSTGIARQTIDDPKLVALLERLSTFEPPTAYAESSSLRDDADVVMADGAATSPPNVDDELVKELEKWPAWRFEEQADLYEWIRPLNAIDAALTQLMNAYPALLLIARSKKRTLDTDTDGEGPSEADARPSQAESLADVEAVPASVVRSMRTLLRFLSNLLRNATNKSVFNSVEELSDLLGASDDAVASLALEALSNLACPPMLHRQQAPEIQQHSTALHTSSSSPPSPSGVHGRIMALARGWGSKGSGLGLHACVTADDSAGGQGSLPQHAGELVFEYFGAEPETTAPARVPRAANGSPLPAIATAPPAGDEETPTGGAPPRCGTGAEAVPSRLVTIKLTADEMKASSRPQNEGSSKDSGQQAEKRRRMGSPATSRRSFSTKSTAELFFLCLEKAGGRSRVPREKMFALLAELWLAKSFHSSKCRIEAVERRLRALVCVLHAVSSQDGIAAYFHAQPELCAELVDLVRPTVSSVSVSSAAPLKTRGNGGAGQLAAITALADSPTIPYAVRTLAVDCLTAIVARRDGAGGGGLSSVARQVNVLGELGVGKGQYLGFLPTLIRYSLASLNAFLFREDGAEEPAESKEEGKRSMDDKFMKDKEDDDTLGLSLGLAFLEATKPPALPRQELEERALEFIDCVLMLTSAVVAIPSGTAALTDCGIIPALVSTVALDSQSAQKSSGNEESPFAGRNLDDGESYSGCLLKFISAQAIQILEGAIVTHNTALSAFHDLHGVDLLVSRLHVEVKKVQGETADSSSSAVDAEESGNEAIRGGASLSLETGDVTMETGDKPSVVGSDVGRSLRAAQRVLLFSIVNCLTVVFHQQESSSSSSSTPSGGAQLRKPELTKSIMEIMDNVSSYGGVLAALAATLLSDVMNADPQVVHHVHNSGLAKSFLAMLIGNDGRCDDSFGDDVEHWGEPYLPTSSELFMGLPNVISALSLTEEGARKIKEVNPFPALLSVFCCPNYAMPKSRCLLNEMAAIIGTGLDEVMRHVPSLKPLVIKAIVQTMRRVVFLGRELLRNEEEQCENSSIVITDLEASRTYLMQYAYNVGQLLEQILHSEEHISPFVDAGGLDALLELQPLLMPSGRQFLSNVSCLSSPSVASDIHSTTASALTVAIKSIATHYEPHKLLKKISESLDLQLGHLGKSRRELRDIPCKTTKEVVNSGAKDDDENLDAAGILQGIPRIPLHRLEETREHTEQMRALSRFLRSVMAVEWLVNILSSLVRAACQKSHEMGTGWGRSEREWKKEISSASFEDLVRRICKLHRSALAEVCRVRTEDGFEARDLERRQPPGHGTNESHPSSYRIRIVCQDGAIVRDGIEIDSCASIGSLEMGEIVEAFDRCINSSGVMRYRTLKGWVSEHTRGHGRDPIAEVVNISGVAKSASPLDRREKKKRIECGIPDLCSVSASILARLQNSQTVFFSCLSRAVALGVRSLPLRERSLSFQPGTIGAHVGTMLKIMSSNLKANFKLVLGDEVKESTGNASVRGAVKSSGVVELKNSGKALYIGAMLNLLHAAIYEEKRERRTLNVPLLLRMLYADGFEEGISPPKSSAFPEGDAESSETKRAPLEPSFLAAVRFVLNHSLADLSELSARKRSLQEDLLQREASGKGHQSVSRAVAASLPPAISFLRRLIGRRIIMESPMSSVLKKLKHSDLMALISNSTTSEVGDTSDETSRADDAASFHPGRFTRAFHCAIAELTFDVWNDQRLACAPAHILHPVVSLFGEVLASIEDASKDSNDNTATARAGSQGNETLQQRISRNISAMSAFLGGGGPGDGPPLNWRAPTFNPEPFEPSEETIERMIEMGFSRDHALDALETTESNQLEVAMEYALGHSPPSPATVERRRAAREERRRQRELEASASNPSERATSVAGEEEGERRNALSEPADAAAESTADAAQESTNDMDVEDGEGEAGDALDSSGERVQGDAADDGDMKGSSTKKEEEQPMTDEEKNALREKEFEAQSIAMASRCLEKLKSCMTNVSLNLIEGVSTGANESKQLDSQSSSKALRRVDDGTGSGDGEAEAVALIVCSFLLDLCERYPEKRADTVSELLKRLKANLHVELNGVHCRVQLGKDSGFASLAHATAIILRALPRTRPLVLRHGLVGCMLHCVRNVTLASAVKRGNEIAPTNPMHWPRWLAPALLLLDVMAQPTAASIDDDDLLVAAGRTQKENSKERRGEFGRMCAERSKQTTALSKAGKQIFDAVNKQPACAGSKKKKVKETTDATKQGEERKCQTKHVQASDAQPSSTGEEEDSKPKAKASSIPPFPAIPPYLPLIPPETAEACMLLCLQLLGLRAKKSSSVDDEEVPRVSPPPGIVYAALQLLARVLRSQHLASQCVRMGGAELILSLPGKSRFSGSAGLVTVIFRRLLEDETTLQSAMETEIRSQVAKLHKKQGRGPTRDGERPKVSSRSFVQAVTPLICRDPLIFLKAAATSVRVESFPTESGNAQSRIILLTAEERARNVKALSSAFGGQGMPSSSKLSSPHTGSKPTSHNNHGAAVSASMGQKRGRSTAKSKAAPMIKGTRGKSPHPGSSKRGISPKRLSSKKDRPERSPHQHLKKYIVLNGTPANHVTSLLLAESMKLTEKNVALGNHDAADGSFLSIVDCLEILADLVLAFPACAAAIHRYRPPDVKDRKLCDPGRQSAKNNDVPATAVGFLLHNLLPKPREICSSGRNDHYYANDADSDLVERRKQRDYMKVKIAQTTARLLVALVARAGEGRRRVVMELSMALSGRGSKIAPSCEGEDTNMWALRSWGELCIGLAAPRSNGVNHDSNSTLSFEVVRQMLDSGMAHALMRGIQRVKLHHPMAASTASALLRPLEIFTRAHVVDTIHEMIEKDEQEKKKDGKRNVAKDKRRITIGPSQQSEGSFADDAMLEDGFDADTAERTARRSARRRDFRRMVEDAADIEDDDEDMEEIDEFSDDDMDDEDENSDDERDDDDDFEVRLRNVDYSDEASYEDSESEGSSGSEDEDSDDEIITSESEPETSLSVSMEEVDEDEDEDEEQDDEEEGNEGERAELEGGDDFLEDNDDFFEGHADEGREGGEEDPVEAEAEEGWTRIDAASGLGGMLLGVRPSAAGGSASRQRASGFIVDAAEAMIGNLLRSGEVQMDALAEIEDTLGIRIMHRRDGAEQRDSIGASSSSGRNRPPGNAEGDSRNRGSVGAIPGVHQSSPPDSGYAMVSLTGRWGEINSMEYIFGGPAIGAGSRNYDLALSQEMERPRHHAPSNVNTQLFPNGPAASTHSRSQQLIHPLLCGVELPPFNSLVSALRPHGEQLQELDQSPDGMVSSGMSAGGNITTSIRGANGTVITVNRSSVDPFMEQQSARVARGGFGVGLVGWTDDGQPLDITTGDFSTAFEQALGATMARQTPSDAPDPPPAAAVSGSGDGTSGADTGSGDATTHQQNTEGEPEGSSSAVANNEAGSQESNVASAPVPQNDDRVEDGEAVDGATANSSENQEDTGENYVPPAGNHNSERASSEGEVVASSLAAGLNLSPSSESSNAPAGTSEGPAERQTSPQSLHQELPEECGGTAEDMDDTEQDQDRISDSATREDGEAGDNSAAAIPSPSADASADATPQDPSSESQPNPSEAQHDPNEHGLVCPPGMDLEVFNQLPMEMQQEVIQQHQATSAVAAQLDSASGLDPEALAALPEEMRREIIEQEQQERRSREQQAADPSNAEEMDNASFVASLAPDLREEILLTADDTFLNSLPPDIIAEAQILRERAATQHRRRHEESLSASNAPGGSGGTARSNGPHQAARNVEGGTSRKRSRTGKVRAELDRSNIVYVPQNVEEELGPLITTDATKALLRLYFLLSPVQPQRLLQKLLQNLCGCPELRRALLTTFVALLNDDPSGAVAGVNMVGSEGSTTGSSASKSLSDDFPPSILIGTAPDVEETDESLSSSMGMFRRRQDGNTAAAIAASLPASARGSSHDEYLPPVVAKRIVNALTFLSKSSPRICVDMLNNTDVADGHDDCSEMVLECDQTCLDRLLDLLDRPLYSKSSTNLEQLLTLLEYVVAPLSLLPKDGDRDAEISKRELDAAAAAGKEYLPVPQVTVSQQRLHLLCSVLRLETCKDACFAKVNTVARRLCKIEANRHCILRELASVAQGLGADAIRDLRFLSIRLNDAVNLHQEQLKASKDAAEAGEKDQAVAVAGSGVAAQSNPFFGGTPSSAVTLSTSTSELKLLRVLQTLHSLCADHSHDEHGKKHDGSGAITPELVSLLRSIDLESLWDHLTSCLRIVSVLEGVAKLDDFQEEKEDDGDTNENESDAARDDDDIAGGTGKKLQNSVAGLLTRFLPTIEAFFVVNGSSTVGGGENGKVEEVKSPAESTGREGESSETKEEVSSPSKGVAKAETGEDADLVDLLVGGKRLLEFVATNKILLNALLRSNPALLEKGLKAMVQVPRCRSFLDFDVKRQWFKTQVRRLRQHASRRHGSLRLNLRRKNVFEDAFHAFQIRNADELRGRLHITFRDEEGVDAGGLSREFFAILAKEMFNPNYALFTSTEDGCTFQPNPNSSINPDHLRYFRFVGRIVGKAVVDGFLLDAHFTRSLYKHMLGIKPTHHDMQAIDPDYYKNLQTILEFNLGDIGLDLTFSTEDHSFGRSHTIDLIPNGRHIAVTEETKAKYVSLVCQHRMTTAIESQIKAYLEGFNELVDPDLISIFTAKELELLISGMPDIDIHDLKKNTEYHGYRAADKEISWFWNIMFSLTRSEKAAFLQFATGSSKVPLAGFSELQGMRGVQKFSIHKAGGASGALMSAHTCFNALDLPVYQSEEEMREKLLYAISEGGGGFLFA